MEGDHEKIYHTSGMFRAARQAGIEVNRDTTSRPVSHAAGLLTKHFDIITPVFEADGLFNICKMKTHLFTVMTGAVKKYFWRDSRINQNGLPCQTPRYNQICWHATGPGAIHYAPAEHNGRCFGHGRRWTGIGIFRTSTQEIIPTRQSKGQPAHWPLDPSFRGSDILLTI